MFRRGKSLDADVDSLALDSRKPRRRRLHAVVICLLAITGCQSSAEHDAMPPKVSLSFIQQRIDEGTEKAQLRVINTSGRSLHVTGVGVDWPGYGDFLQDYDTTVAPGQTLDLRILMPPPRCEPTSAPTVGVLRVSGVTIRDRLDASGRGFLTRMWQRRCNDLTVANGVTLRYTGPWRIVGSGFHARLVGSLELVRGDSTEPIRVPDLQGSVLLTLRLPPPVVLPAGVSSARFPLEMTAQRCDAHGLSQSTQTFYFRASVVFGHARPLRVIRIPDLHTQDRANALLKEACL